MVKELYQDQKRSEQGGPSHDEGKKKEVVRNLLKFHPLLRLILMVLCLLHLKNKKTKDNFNVPQLNLDIKFELPMYNGELNA